MDFHGDPVGSTLSLAVEIPAKNYGRTEFIKTVTDEVRKTLEEFRRRDFERQKERQQREELEKLADDVWRNL